MRLRLEHNSRDYLFLSGDDGALSPAGPGVVRFSDASAARRFLGRFTATPDVRRRLVALLTSDTGVPGVPAGVAPDALLDDLARRLARGEVEVRESLFDLRGGALTERGEAAGAAGAAAVAAPAATWIAFRAVDDATGNPIPGVTLPLQDAAGQRRSLVTGADGRVRLELPEEGSFQLTTGGRRPAALADTWAFLGFGDAALDVAPLVAGPDAALFPDGAAPRTGALARLEAHRVSAADSIAALANAEGMPWQDLARYNWGTAVPAEINAALELTVGTSKRTKDGRNLMFDDADRPGIVFLPRPIDEAGLATGREHILRLRRPPAQLRLRSRFALEQLTGLARFLSRNAFRGWILSIFGDDVPISAVDALRQALHDGSCPNPGIDLLPPGELDSGEPARYDKARRRVQVDRDLAAAAVSDPEAAGKLLLALVHEFGHHVDQILRALYSSVGGDAPFEEGAAYAHAVVLLKGDVVPRLPYADYFDGATWRRLEIDHGDFAAFAARWASEDLVWWETEDELHAHFGAGPGHGKPGMSFGHESVEDEARLRMDPALRFSPAEGNLIYFGNWLRDYSQAIDPKIIRRPDESITSGLTRPAMTQIVDLLAELHFIEEKGDLDQRSRSLFRVTPAKLGVYRPEEHIDNPKGIEDGRADDPAFRGDWTEAEVAIDPVRNMKNYIATPGPWATSSAYITSELRQAVALGRTPEGFRRLGQALHVLEDFFAHSNWCELALRKVGYSRVDPWVPVTPGRVPPLVTGVFGGLDTAASILYVIGESLRETDPFAVGKRTSGQRILLIALHDTMPNVARGYELFLKFGEEFQKDHPWIWKILYDTVGAFSRFMNVMIGNMIHSIAADIDDYQSKTTARTTDPTHTQIAKDHDDHPLHTLAAHIAIEAVRQVFDATARAWAGEAGGGVEEVERRAHRVRTGETIASLADSIGISWQELARYNWGTAVPAEINSHLYSDVGCRTKIGVNYIFTDADEPGIVYLPIRTSTPGATDPAALAVHFLAHPEASTELDELVRDWARANPGAVAAASTRTSSTAEWEELKQGVDGWGTALEDPDAILKSRK